MNKVFIFLIALVFLVGCSPKEIFVDRYIQTNCEVVRPQLGQYSNSSTSLNVRELLIYTEELECLLDFCINGEFPKECIAEYEDD